MSILGHNIDEDECAQLGEFYIIIQNLTIKFEIANVHRRQRRNGLKTFLYR